MRQSIAIAVLASATFAWAADHHPAPAHDEPKPAAHAAPAPVAAPAPTPAPASSAITADIALQRLQDGNRRYTAGDSEHPRADQDRRSETYSAGQHPIVSILSCADSRVPPEILFDAGIGDLFVIRVAGNVSDTDEIATLEYGAGHLHTPLIVVMGHTKCGAVAAIVDGAELHGNLAALTDNIRPAASAVKDAYPNLKGQTLNNKVVRANVFQSISDLLNNSAEIRSLVEKKDVKIVGAVYDINSGFIDWLGEHPRQDELLKSPKPAAPSASHAVHDDHAPAKGDPHAKPAKPDSAHADTAQEKHSAADNKDEKTKAADAKEAVSPLKKYGPLGAFAIGSVALSAVLLHLVRK